MLAQLSTIALLCLVQPPHHLVAPDGESYDAFGTALDISGDLLIAGAPNHSTAAYLAGAAYAYAFDGVSWNMIQKLTPPSVDAYGEFGCAIALQGDTAAVGWMGALEGEERIGKVVILHWSGDQWLTQQVLTDPDAENGDRFGVSIALDGDQLIVGCQLDDEAAWNAGSALVFQRSIDGWTFQSRLLPAQGDEFSWAGRDVDIEGELAVMGAYKEWNKDLQAAGAAYVFRHDSTMGWINEARLQAMDPAAGNYFGFSLNLDGERIAIGSILNDATGEDSGAVYMFDKADGTWSQTKLAPPDAGGEFGYGLNLSGSDLFVGSVYHPGPGFATGAVYRYELTDDNWIWRGKWLPMQGADNCFFGASIISDEDNIGVGSPREDSSGPWSGAVYVHDRRTPCPADVNEDVHIDVNDLLLVVSHWGLCENCVADIDGNGIVDANDLLQVIGLWGWCL